MNEDMREFLLVLRRALKMIVSWIEKKCDILPEPHGFPAALRPRSAPPLTDSREVVRVVERVP